MAETAAPSRPILTANPTAGIAWMLTAGLLFVAVTALVKAVGTDVPAAQSAFLRYVLGLIFILPALPALVRLRLDRRRAMMIGARGAAHTLAVILWFYAMARIPIAEVTAMNYLNPIYVTLFAGLVFREGLSPRRVAAVAAGFLGALIILRPGLREIGPGHIAMLVTAVAMAASYLIAKRLSDEFTPGLVVTLLSITVTVGLAPFAAVVWVPIGWEDLALLFGVAFFATAGHYAMTRAFQAAPLTVTQPVTFLQLVWATALGWAVFGEAIDAWVILGGGIIIGAVTYIAWREAVGRRAAAAMPPG